jgi:hypothetical protein
MAGTPTKMVARRVSMASSRASARNVGRNQAGMPAPARPRRVANPMMWDTGNESTASSRRSPEGQRADAVSEPTSALCVSRAPLGRPVVPEV